MRSVRWLLVPFAAAAASGACGDTFSGTGGGAGSGGSGGSPAPADVTGHYTINVTSGPNGCQFANWTEGAMTTNIDFTITQDIKDPTMITGTLGGLAGTYADLVLGSHT